MKKLSLGLLVAVLGCVWACGPLAQSAATDTDGGGGGDGGGGDATITGPSSDAASQGGQDSTTSDTGSQLDDAGTDASGPQDSGPVVPPIDAAPPPACSEANATWVPGAGISTAGWTATATATDTTDTNVGDFVVGNAFDGDLTTRWSSGKAQTGGEGFRLDLGQVRTISQVAFFDKTDFPATYTLALSPDDVNYTQVGTGVGGQPTAICFPAQQARYIKIIQTGLTGSWFSIYEISVFQDSATSDAGTDAATDDSGPLGDAAPPPVCSETNATWVAGAGISSAGWTATASATATTDTNAGDFTVANAFDSNLTTRWSSGKAQTGGEWFRLDLGQEQTISQVAFFDKTDFTAAYSLALSSDDITYTQVATGLGAQPTAICFPAQSARYIKITQTGVSGSWFSIYEINVFQGSATTDAGSPLDAAADGGDETDAGSPLDAAADGSDTNDGGSQLDAAAD